jgi:hypothetical protein
MGAGRALAALGGADEPVSRMVRCRIGTRSGAKSPDYAPGDGGTPEAAGAAELCPRAEPEVRLGVHPTTDPTVNA